MQMKIKLDSIHKRHVGLTKIATIPSVISPTALRILAIVHVNDSTPFEEFTPSQIASFCHAPVTSIDVERVFSRYKSVLQDNRKSFAESSLWQYLLIHVNSQITISIYTFYAGQNNYVCFRSITDSLHTYILRILYLLTLNTIRAFCIGLLHRCKSQILLHVIELDNIAFL